MIKSDFLVIYSEKSGKNAILNNAGIKWVIYLNFARNLEFMSGTIAIYGNSHMTIT